MLFLFWLACKALASFFRASRGKRKRKPETIQRGSTSALMDLQRQRAIYTDMIDNITDLIDNAPPNRDKLLKEQAALYSKLAIVEQKIHKLCY